MLYEVITQVGLGVPERALWLEFEAVDEDTRKIVLPDTVSLPEHFV